MNLFATSTQIGNLFNIPSERFKYFNSPNQYQDSHDPLRTASEFLEDLKQISSRITLRMKPDGSETHPARSCRDIADYHPDKPNGTLHFACFINSHSDDSFPSFFLLGLYYIDPNEGSKTDAVLVYCKLSERLTCINSTNGLVSSKIFSHKPIVYGKRTQLMRDILQQIEVE